MTQTATTRLRVAFAVPVLLLLACAETVSVPGPFTGTWAGGDGSYQASLTLSQVQDTVRGGFRITRPADSTSVTSPALKVPLHGDSVAFSFSAPEAGFTMVGVRGQRRGDRLDTEIALDSTIVLLELRRQ